MESSRKDGLPDDLVRELYRTALETRNMEIGLFWHRASLFLALNTALAVGFFSLESERLILLLSFMGLVVSALWVLVNLGSKYWQSRWEERLHKTEALLADGGLDLFAAEWDTIDEDVEDSLRKTRGGDPGLLRRAYIWGVMKKPSVSLMMTLLSAFFFLLWSGASILYLARVSGNAHIDSYSPRMDWAILATSVALVALTGVLAYFTWGLVAEARNTRAEMRATRDEMEEVRRLGVRPHLAVEPVMHGPVYAALGVRNLGPGSARNVSLIVEFDPLGDVREMTAPVIIPGHVEQFLLPQKINDLDAAQAAGLVSHVRGTMEDLYGEPFPVDLTFDWAPWVEKVTGANRLAYREPGEPIVKALGGISKALAKIEQKLGRAGRNGS